MESLGAKYITHMIEFIPYPPVTRVLVSPLIDLADLVVLLVAALGKDAA